MRQRLRPHLTYANVISTLCLFLLLGGGSAVALNGSNTVQSDDLGPGAQVKAPDIADAAVNSADIANGQVKNPDIANGAVTGDKVANNSLTGADIANRSGVDTCPSPAARYGPICAFSDGALRHWQAAVDFCASKGLRLPSVSEAFALAENYDIAGVSDTQPFWTESELNTGASIVPGSIEIHMVQDKDSQPDALFNNETLDLAWTVCVTEPSA